MKSTEVIETVKSNLADAKSKGGMIVAHGQDIVHTGVETLKAAKDVVVGAGREALDVATRAKDELKRTLTEGASQVGHKVSHLATPTHKEEAAARKAEVKAKKQRKRSETEAPASEDQAEA
jgi:hypothetical protein